jgi:maltooligosyltrehalose trehalohydrolase
MLPIRDTTSRQGAISPAAPAVYRVWAPIVERLALVVDGDQLPMTRGEGGWWTADRQVRHGDRYGYMVDGEGPFPDPRTRFQPSGVHGLSEWIEHDRFPWTDDGWQAGPLAAGVIYELHVGTFTRQGTFDAAIARLPYLVDLGITHVQLMPLAEFSGDRGWGYDGVDLFAPHHRYGRPEDLKRLVDACHAHGLAVIIDIVYNHFGPDGNYLSRFGPYFTRRYHTPWGDAVNLDGPGSDEVRRFFCDNTLMWLRDYHADGLRLDAVHALIDASATHLVEQLTTEVDALEVVSGRHLVLIAESDLNDPRVIQPRELGGYGADAQWNDDFHHAVHSVITGERSGYYADFGTIGHIATALREAFVYTGNYSVFRQRTHGRVPHGLPGWRFVVAVQNHDQIGNRANGERLGHLAPVGRVKIAAALMLTSPFIPMLFQGEEWGASTPFCYFTAYQDEALGAAVSEGRRREFAAFGWDPRAIPDPQARDTFERSCLRWEEATGASHGELLEWYRALIALRSDYPSLRNGDYRSVRVTYDEDARYLVIRRREIVVACNLSGHTSVLPIDGAARLLLASADVHIGDTATIPPDSVAILKIDDPVPRSIS